MGELVSVEELGQHVHDPSWRVIDCRFSLADADAGSAAYQKGHLPGAYYADLNKQLSGPVVAGRTGRHPLPNRDALRLTVAHWRITPDTHVVAYDDAGGAFAARLWWLLRWLGHEQVRVLDGGWQHWLASRGPVTMTAPVIDSELTPYPLRPALTRLVDIETILSTTRTLLDARDEARFRGDVEPIDPIAGHIPGAACVPFADNLDNGLFRDAEELRERFLPYWREVTSETTVPVCYCGSGVTAAHNILAAVHAGLPEPALYAGSWSEWILDSTRDIARGS